MIVYLLYIIDVLQIPCSFNDRSFTRGRWHVVATWANRAEWSLCTSFIRVVCFVSWDPVLRAQIPSKRLISWYNLCVELFRQLFMSWEVFCTLIIEITRCELIISGRNDKRLRVVLCDQLRQMGSPCFHNIVHARVHNCNWRSFRAFCSLWDRLHVQVAVTLHL